ncbi:DUF3784 domain-containing protein [Faecalicoccus acidiformans]|uniref:DUF3784 domain-containing protein n=1 Tax=Faecalicoccus acidiformans TaxID=915173 RepID=UPI0023577F5C|nr:DUF3784 domain-containing protein [Faecalicoccus acidiformans]
MFRVFLVIVFLALSLVFFMGKGSFLIAGYNTSGKAEKAKYDEKRLCRFVGIATLMFSLGLLVTVLDEDLAWLELVLFFGGIATAIIGGNFFSKKKTMNADEPEIGQEDDRTSKIIKRGSLIFTLIVLAGIGGLLFAGDVNVNVGEDSVEVNAFMAGGSTIKYSDVEEIYLSDDVDFGSRVGGFGGLKISSGNFENDQFGRYKLYVYNDNDSLIVLKTKEDQYIVFNLQSQKDTEKVYESIAEKVN